MASVNYLQGFEPEPASQTQVRNAVDQFWTAF